MKRFSSILFCLIILSGNSFAQKVRVNSLNRSFERVRTTKVFDYVHDEFDTTKLEWVADLTIEFDTIIPGMIGECFKQLKEKANNLGASSFKVTSSDIESIGDKKFISISTYWLRMEDRGENYSLYNDNKLYLFGLLGYHESIDGYPITVNEEEFVIHGLTYHEYEFLDDQKVNIMLGSKTRGASEHLHVKDGMRPKFYYFNMVKGSFKNAWIDEYHENFGLYLTKILKIESE